MTLIPVTPNVLFGYSTDVKPTAGIAANTLLFELDTGDTWKYTAGTWSFFSGKSKPEVLTNKTLITPVISSVKDNSGNIITFPTGNRTLVGRDTTDTLSNKTLVQPTVSSFYNGGVITLPTGTHTLMGRSTSETMSGKIININSNTLTANSIALGDLLLSNGTQFFRLGKGTTGQVLTSNASTVAWADAAAGGAGVGTINTWTAAQTFNDTKFLLRNPANTFSLTVKSGAQAAARVATFPVMSGDDTIELTTIASSPTNKTIAVDSNTIKHSTTNASGDLLISNGTSFVRTARGTANQVLAVASDGNSVAWTSFNAERTGTATASGNGSATIFNVPHGLGSSPYMAQIQCYTLSTPAFTYTWDATNIVVTFASAPPSASNNVKFSWRVVQ